MEEATLRKIIKNKVPCTITWIDATKTTQTRKGVTLKCDDRTKMLHLHTEGESGYLPIKIERVTAITPEGLVI